PVKEAVDSFAKASPSGDAETIESGTEVLTVGSTPVYVAADLGGFGNVEQVIFVGADGAQLARTQVTSQDPSSLSFGWAADDGSVIGPIGTPRAHQAETISEKLKKKVQAIL